VTPRGGGSPAQQRVDGSVFALVRSEVEWIVAIVFEAEKPPRRACTKQPTCSVYLIVHHKTRMLASRGAEWMMLSSFNSELQSLDRSRHLLMRVTGGG
jgi:hypothetical protein